MASMMTVTSWTSSDNLTSTDDLDPSHGTENWHQTTLTSTDDLDPSDGTENWLHTTLTAEDNTQLWRTLTSEGQSLTTDYADYAGVLTILLPMTQRTLTEYITIALIAVLGLVGNALVVIVMIKNSVLRKQATNVLILNQSVIDFMAAISISITSTIEVLYAYGLINVQLNDSSFFSHLWCAWFQNHDIIRPFFYTSTLSMICIAVERYIGICHPFTHLKWGKNKIVKPSLVFMYLLGPVISLYLPHATTRLEDGHCVWKITKLIANIEVPGVLMTYYVLPIAVLVTLYALIVKKLASNLEANSNNGNYHVSTEKKTYLAKVNTIKMLITVAAFFIICWTGVIIDYILVTTNTFRSDVMYTVCELLMFANCCCNPFIYILRSKTFRRKTIQLFSSFTTVSEAST